MPVADVGGNLRHTRLYIVALRILVRDTRVVHVDERTGRDVRLPLVDGDFSHIVGVLAVVLAGARRNRRLCHVAQSDRRGDTANQLVIPLVERGYLPVPGRNSLEIEVPIGVALGEHEVRAVRIAQADVAGTQNTDRASAQPQPAADTATAAGDNADSGTDQNAAQTPPPRTPNIRTQEVLQDLYARRRQMQQQPPAPPPTPQ